MPGSNYVFVIAIKPKATHDFCRVVMFLFNIGHYHWGAQIPGCHFAVVTKFCMVAHDILGPHRRGD
jgi:hypothetical protein